MNNQQLAFITRALKQLNQVIETCSKNSSSASETLGRKQLGRHTVVVKLIAEVDNGFAAPLSSHNMGSHSIAAHPAHTHAGDSLADSSDIRHSPANKIGAEPDYSKQTEHHNTNRGSRWHKPIF